MAHIQTQSPHRPLRLIPLILTLVLAGLTLGACNTSTNPAADPAATASPSPTASAQGGKLLTGITLGYYTGEDNSLASIKTAAAYLTDVSADLWSVTSTGGLDNSDIPTDLLAWDSTNDIHTWACISNYGSGRFDGDLGHAVLTNAPSTAITNLVALAVDNGFAGVNLDFEAIPPSDREAYTSFVTNLAASLHNAGKKLMLSIPAIEEDDPSDDWAGAFDYPALGTQADLIQLMTYDQNGPWSNPGPVSGADWVQNCVSYAASVVNPSKLLIGLPAYGYDWNQTAMAAGDSTQNPMQPWTSFSTLAAKSAAGPQWDTASSSPWLNYTDSNGDTHVLWYENAQSLQTKMSIASNESLGGISVWCLGYDDLGFWQALAGN